MHNTIIKLVLDGTLATQRDLVIDQIDMLAHASKQLDYERSVPIADVYAELLCGADDLLRPKNSVFVAEFTEAELRDLAHLYGVLMEASNLKVNCVSDLLKEQSWRRVMELAKELLGKL